jgi:hypothetical protein
MSEPANRPLKPDGTYYRPGERLAMAAAKMKPVAKKARPAPENDWGLESEIARALQLMRSV